MKKQNYLLVLMTALFMVPQFAFSQDWANLNRFKEINSQVLPITKGEKRVVFMGNSITEGWINKMPEYFTNGYINRGISGQTTPQMLLRFRQDVIALNPKVVVILAGTNDIAGNTGPSTLQMIEDNLVSMVELAKANDIIPVLCSVLPAYEYPWKKEIKPVQQIADLNSWIASYCKENKIKYVDFFTPLADERSGLPEKYSKDGVHPNIDGYTIMVAILNKTLNKVLKKRF